MAPLSLSGPPGRDQPSSGQPLPAEAPGPFPGRPSWGCELQSQGFRHSRVCTPPRGPPSRPPTRSPTPEPHQEPEPCLCRPAPTAGLLVAYHPLHHNPPMMPGARCLHACQAPHPGRPWLNRALGHGCGAGTARPRASPTALRLWTPSLQPRRPLACLNHVLTLPGPCPWDIPFRPPDLALQFLSGQSPPRLARPSPRPGPLPRGARSPPSSGSRCWVLLGSWPAPFKASVLGSRLRVAG